MYARSTRDRGMLDRVPSELPEFGEIVFYRRFSIGATNVSTTLACVCLVIPCAAAVQDERLAPADGPPMQPSDAPPISLWETGGETICFGAKDHARSIYREVSCQMLDKRITFSWRYAAAAPSIQSVSATTSQSFDTPYWPTRALVVDPQHLFVAGKALDGATILERWTFAKRSTEGVPLPSVSPSCGADGSQTQHYEWTIPPRTDVEELIDVAPDSPRGLIRGLIRDLKSKNNLFVYFDRSREIYSLDVVRRTQSLVAGPTASAPMQVPALTDNYKRYWSCDYKKRGYCYFFGADLGVIKKEGNPDFLVLIDADRDGKIDSSTIITGKQWTTDGWSDTANILPHDY
jgi:hypothetical protein